MCLILVAWRAHPRWPLVICANRDEFFARPAAPAGFWPDAPDVLAGRDLSAGGTWLGVTRQGRFAALTNYRNPADIRDGAPSRGALVADFLRGKDTPEVHLAGLAQGADRYNGFGLLAATRDQLGFLSNRGGPPELVSPGVHGLSNQLLDTPWPKVVEGRARLSRLLEGDVDADTGLALLDDTTPAPDAALPDTGVGPERERWLSSLRIPSDPLRGMSYGTRCSTFLRIDADGRGEFVERTFQPDGSVSGTVRFEFSRGD